MLDMTRAYLSATHKYPQLPHTTNYEHNAILRRGPDMGDDRT